MPIRNFKEPDASFNPLTQCTGCGKEGLGSKTCASEFVRVTIHERDASVKGTDHTRSFCDANCMVDYFLAMGVGSAEEISRQFGNILHDSISHAIVKRVIPEDNNPGR